MLTTKIVSSQEKVFLDQNVSMFAPLTEISALQGEKLSFQLLYADIAEGGYLPRRPYCEIRLTGELASCTTLRDVRWHAVDRPTNPDYTDANYLRTDIGVYPDILTPLRYDGKVCPSRDKLRSIWGEIQIPEDASGDFSLTAEILLDGRVLASESFTVHIIAAKLPAQKMHFTQWFYADCLASYYNVPVWSDRHFEIIENFARTAVLRGRDTLYVPLFTPALNVLPGYERLPTQLLGVTLTNGEYTFDFTNLDRYLDICRRVGVQYYEISHFYQQDQAKHAAHIYATVDGEYKRLFGWETEALDVRYTEFLRAAVSAFIAHMKETGEDARCLFHISDEPYLPNIEQYRAAKNAVADLLEGYTVLDALSDYDFYETGAVACPVPTTTSAPAFIRAGVPNLWVYYACGELVDYSNCYVAMPSYRTRSIGMQLFKYNIAGFLHWGYNYYNNRASGDAINPYLDLGGEDWVPAGDTFTVYPGEDGTPLESIRTMTVEEAMQDIRAMQLCESLYSHEEVVAAIESVLGEELDFRRCARSSKEMLSVREKINSMIAEKINT